MILQENIKKVSGTLPEVSDFKIETTSKAFEILSSGLYNNKEAAVIRELCCNAYDSHLEAKNPEPFQVFFPTELNPNFTVKDFGTGLSEENIFDLYSTYFGSNKTTSNIFTGALGLGSKSPFSISNQFTVESRYGETKNVYLCFISEKGVPQISKLSSESLKEETGLTITVPVKKDSIDVFKKEGVKVLSFFKHTPVCHNISPIETIFTSENKVFENFYIIRNSNIESSLKIELETLVFLQANVIYKISFSELLDKIHSLKKFNSDKYKLFQVFLTGFKLQSLIPIIEVTNGTLDFTASREELALTERTLKNIIKILYSILNKYKDLIIKEYIESKTPLEFVKEFTLSKSNRFDVFSAFIAMVTRMVIYNNYLPIFLGESQNKDTSLKLIKKIDNMFLYNKETLSNTFFIRYKTKLEKSPFYYYMKTSSGSVKKVSVSRYQKVSIIDYTNEFFFLDTTKKAAVQSAILKAYIDKTNVSAIVITDRSVIKYFPKFVEFKSIWDLEDYRKRKPSRQPNAYVNIVSNLTSYAISHNTNKSIGINLKLTPQQFIEEYNNNYKGTYIVYTQKHRQSIIIQGKTVRSLEVIQQLNRLPFLRTDAMYHFISDKICPLIVAFPSNVIKNKKYEEDFAGIPMISLDALFDVIAGKFIKKAEGDLKMVEVSHLITYNLNSGLKSYNPLHDYNTVFNILRFNDSNIGSQSFIKQQFPTLYNYIIEVPKTQQSKVYKTYRSTYNDDKFSIFWDLGYLNENSTFAKEARDYYEELFQEVKRFFEMYPLISLMKLDGYYPSSYKEKIVQLLMGYFSENKNFKFF